MPQQQSFRVPPRSWAAIEATASALRRKWGLADVEYFPVMEILDALDKHSPGFCFLAGDREEMAGAEGYTDPSGKFIQLREDVMNAGFRGDGRARFTAAHELGHLVLHTNVPLCRVEPGQRVEQFRLSEPQANQFAGAILMSSQMITALDDEWSLVDRFGVSREAAAIKLRQIRK